MRFRHISRVTLSKGRRPKRAGTAHSPNTRALLETESARFVYIYLVKHARGVITDSGGITEETTVLGALCLTPRDNTEHSETITIGTNELVGTDPNKLLPVLATTDGGPVTPQLYS